MSQHPDRTVSNPTLSSGDFILWSLLLIAMIMAIWYNYTLIISPMSEMVGGKTKIGGASVASIGAGVIVVLEIFMGLFFLETSGATTFFPVIHALKAPARKSLQIYTVFMLFMFALIQVGLILMRDILVTQENLVTQYKMTGQMPVAAQMAIEFILPFILVLTGLSLDRVVRMLRGQSA